MYAIVDIAGQQFKVEKNQKICVHSLNRKEGEKIILDKVLFIEDAKKVTIGTPTIDKMSVKATVLEHLKGDKVIVFKKKRRKGYKLKRGHRQCFTRLQINDISASRASAKTPVVAEKEKKVVEKSVTTTPKVTPAKVKKAPAPKAKAAVDTKTKKEAPKKVSVTKKSPTTKKAPVAKKKPTEAKKENKTTK